MATATKHLLLPFVFALLLAACSVQKPVKQLSTPEIKPEDSTEYELIVFDPGFETWYLLKKSPAMDHSIDYYKNWNMQYVQAWNNSSGMRNLFGSPINYEYREKYPFELEHKLYYYFQYVENELKIPILNPGSQVPRIKH
jgi:hypothetical protein